MVKIVKAHTRQGEKGQFMSLELQSGIEMVQSQSTGNFYATVRKCFVSTTFDAETANSFVGQSLPGNLVRVPCEPYEYSAPGSKDKINLSHTYAYVPVEAKSEEVDEDVYYKSEIELLK